MTDVERGPAFYVAKGNTYFVVSPQGARALVDIPQSAAEAAQSYKKWARLLVDQICSTSGINRSDQGRKKEYRSNGLLVGPFSSGDSLELLIVNTNGTLAERSGNGLTIFAQSLFDGRSATPPAFRVRIHHANPDQGPTEAQIERGELEGRSGFWIDMGKPTFGLEAVRACPEDVGSSKFGGRAVSRIFVLEQIEAKWAHSYLVNVGNPHCVTFVGSLEELPSMEELKSERWQKLLQKVADSSEHPGANQEWTTAARIDRTTLGTEGRGREGASFCVSVEGSACGKPGLFPVFHRRRSLPRELQRGR